MASNPPQADYDEIVRGLRILISPGLTFEARALAGQRRGADNGYFRDIPTAANAICNSDHAGRVGIYVTVNAVNPECYARAADCIIKDSGGFTTDGEVPSLRWLMIDIDPKRPKGISATDTEKAYAHRMAMRLKADLNFMYGWTLQPVIVDSGNGYHMYYKLVDLANLPENVALIKAVLVRLAELYDSDEVSIDTSVHNPSRIMRCPGTVARKGSHCPEEGRPHRLSRVIQDHDPLDMLSKSQLELVATPQTHGMNGTAFNGSVYPHDETLYRQLNRDALILPHLDIWVPHIFEQWGPTRLNGSWEIKGENLNRGEEERISFHPKGIKDFGVYDMGDPRGGSRTAVEVIAEWITNGDKRHAAHLLASTLDLPATIYDRVPLGPPQTPVQGLNGSPLGGEPPNGSMALGDATGGYKPAVLRATQMVEYYGSQEAIMPPFVPGWLDGITLLVGDPKAGKSYLALQSCICIALGWPFLGAPTQQADTWYISLEDKREYIDRRTTQILKDLCIENGFEYTDALNRYLVEHMYIHCFTTDDTEQIVTLEQGLPQIAKELDEKPNIKYVVVDPFFLIKGENQTLDIVIGEYRNFRKLMMPFTQRGVHATIVHHTNKGDHSPMNRISGTQAIKAAPETIHVVSKLKFSEIDTGILEVATEMRYHHVPDTRYLKRGINGHFFLTTRDEAMVPTEEEARIVMRYLELTKSPQTILSIAQGSRVDKGRLPAILQLLEDREQIESYGTKFGLSGLNIPHMDGPGRPNEKGDRLKAIVFEHLTGKPNGLRRAEIINMINEGMDIAQSSIDRYLSQFVREGLLVNPKQGYYAIPKPSLPDWL